MGNQLINAGFLDGVDGWAVLPSGAGLTVDETARGAPGRAVLKALSTAASAGATCTVSTTFDTRLSVANLPVIEVQLAAAAFVAGAARPPVAQLVFYDTSGDILAMNELPMRPPLVVRWGEAREGMAETFWRGRGRFVRPAGAAKAGLSVSVASTGAGQALEVLLLKPLIAAPSGGLDYVVWGPGQHRSPDLALPNWPSLLRGFDAGSGSEPQPFGVAFDGGTGLPMTRKITASPVRKFQGRLRCDVVQRAALERFAASVGRFWMIEPDSERLCVAQFAVDGAPRLAQTRGAVHHMDMSLWLETA